MPHPLNRPLIRKIQISILDPLRPFNMLNWDTCIAGHCFRVLNEEGKLKRAQLENWGPCAYASEEMGVPYSLARDLFSTFPGDTGLDRMTAVKRLDAVLKEPSLRGKSRSRSTRATPPEALPEPVAAAEPEVDLSAIDALLKEAEEEMLQTV